MKAGLSGPVMENEMLMFVRHISKSVVGKLFNLRFQIQQNTHLEENVHTHREDSPLNWLILIIN